MKWNLKSRILVPTLAVALTITTALVAVPFLMGRHSLVAALDEQLAALGASTVRQVEEWIGSQRQTLGLWATRPVVLAAVQASADSTPARSALSDEFASFVKLSGYYEVVQLADAKGDTIASSNPGFVGQVNVADRQYFKDALAGRSSLSEVLASKVSGHPIVVLAVPITDGTTVRGVLYGALDLNWFNERVIARIQVLRSGYAFLFDEKGRFIAYPDKKKILDANIADFDWSRSLAGRADGVWDYLLDGTPRRGVLKVSDTLHWGFVVTLSRAELEAPIYRIGKITVFLGLLAVLAGGAALWVAAHSVAGRIQTMADRIAGSAEETAAAAGQIAATSQSLASSTSEQAAAVEQSSGSLEELSGMTKQNASSASQVSELARLARTAAEKGSVDMEAMSAAMTDIKASSDAIGNIIKTIEEIAFQTNLLALNAAVEAARAGEAGAGFTVVAEEVRNLARRSAQAARESADKIEGAIAHGAQGVALNAAVAQTLGDILGKVQQVDALAREVATASAEQTRGLAEINAAVRQMDQVVQKNAASAEEMASATEEVSVQAGVMRDCVAGLTALVHGESRSADSPSGWQRRPARESASNTCRGPSCGTPVPEQLLNGVDCEPRRGADRHSIITKSYEDQN